MIEVSSIYAEMEALVLQTTETHNPDHERVERTITDSTGRELGTIEAIYTKSGRWAFYANKPNGFASIERDWTYFKLAHYFIITDETPIKVNGTVKCKWYQAVAYKYIENGVTYAVVDNRKDMNVRGEFTSEYVRLTNDLIK
jgi:hypothetical protein